MSLLCAVAAFLIERRRRTPEAPMPDPDPTPAPAPQTAADVIAAKRATASAVATARAAAEAADAAYTTAMATDAQADGVLKATLAALGPTGVYIPDADGTITVWVSDGGASGYHSFRPTLASAAPVAPAPTPAPAPAPDATP